jgi:glycosyltransferase involved in cell wall biosynthesis
MTRQLHALVYGDVNLNILDGSAIWVQSMAEALARSGVSTRVLLKAPVHNDRLVAPLQGLAGVTVIDPFTSRVGSLERMDSREPLSVPDAVRILGELDTEQRVDLVVVRGLRLVAGAARNPQLAGRLWTYLTDIPQNPAEGSPATWDTLDDIAAASRFMLCQTEELRSFLEAMVPGASGRAILWPPVVPEPQFDAVEKPALFRAGEPTLARPLRLVYTGKFAAQWNTLEMTDLPAALRAAGLDAELDMVGDKIHDEPDISGWSSQMETALKTAEGVNWRGGVPRQEAMRLSARADVGLSWRDPSMDASLELSTKVLEFASLGIPVLLNRTPMHERLLGSDYPLFASSANEIVAALVSPDLEQTLQLATVRAQASVKDFRMESAIARMRAALSRAFPPSPPSLAQATAAKPLKVGIASHDLKFFTRILEHLDTLQGVEVRLDEWSALAEHDESISKDLVSWADVIICEWAGPNLVWYSRNKRAHQRLIVRLHRFELEAGWLTNVDIDAVDQVVCVSPYYAHLTRERTGWPREKIVVVPNWVDIEQFDRPKLAGAPFVLGMIGISPHRKRPDLGVEVLSVLRRHDERFRLAIKSKLPWDYWWIWRRPEERIETEQLMNRLSDDPTVHDAVSFDGFGGDVATWLRRVGWVLSTSDDESFHLAPAEGMASGAVPALLPWPGADSIYDPHWIHADPAAIASNILEVVHSGQWDTQAALARDQVEASFPLTAICDAWAQLLISDASPDTADEPLYPH